MKNISLAVLAAVVGAAAVQCITLITHAVSWICFLGVVSFEAPDISDSGLGGWIILVPVMGAIAGVLFIKFGKKAITPLSGIIMTGTGIPFGAEGILTSGLFVLGERNLLKAVVVASALACLMKAPVAAVVLVFELGLVTLSFANLAMVALAAAIGAGLIFLWRGWEAVFYLKDLPQLNLHTLYIYFVAGIIVSLLGILMTWLTKLLERVKYQRVWLPAVAAVIIGYLGWQRPEGLGTGYNFIPELAAGTVNLQILLGLSLVRMAMLILAAGTGTPGRELIISPLILIGGALGMGSVFLICLVTGTSGITPGLAAVAGIAALLSGRLPVVFGALILSLEITHQWMVIVPVLVAVIPAILLRKMLVRNDIN
ncbi:chloride channel protein [Chitinophaga sp.]|uniref:chloride channel protein n=1 Tax=Chitinophaga sp. TaxID=1869181 RepID=UPI0031D8D4AF